MTTGSILTPDARAQIERQTKRMPDAPPEAVLQEPEGPPVDEERVCKNTLCKKSVEEAWVFCPSCGRDQISDSPQKKLGITIDDNDVHDYLFKGYIVRDLKILGKHTITVKSSQPSDAEEIDLYLMNGKWSKDASGDERKVSEFFLRQMNSLCMTAAAVHKVDGQSIGKDLPERLKWLKERGSAFVDMVAQRVVWFNQSLTEHLEKEDTFPES